MAAAAQHHAVAALIAALGASATGRRIRVRLTRTCRARAIALLVIGASSSSTLSAQFRLEPRDETFWLTSAAAITASVALDARLASLAQQIQTPTLDRIASDVGRLGQARYILPALALGIIVPRLVGNSSASNAALRITGAYFTADAIASVLKPAIGRHRPDSGGRPAMFRPLRGSSRLWRSMPSGHATHAFAIATALSIEANRPWVTTSVYTLASLVGAQRVYTRAHWASDVVVGGILSTAASATIVRWLQRTGGTLRRQ